MNVIFIYFYFLYALFAVPTCASRRYMRGIMWKTTWSKRFAADEWRDLSDGNLSIWTYKIHIAFWPEDERTWADMSVERGLRSNRLCAINIINTNTSTHLAVRIRKTIRSIHSRLQLTHDAFGARWLPTTSNEKNERNNSNCIKLIWSCRIQRHNKSVRERDTQSHEIFRRFSFSFDGEVCIAECDSRQRKMIFLLLCVPKIAATRYGQSLRRSRGQGAGRKWKYVEEISEIHRTIVTMDIIGRIHRNRTRFEWKRKRKS